MAITRTDFSTGSIVYIDDDNLSHFRIALYTGDGAHITFYGQSLDDLASAKRFAQALQKAIEIWEKEQ